MVERLKVAQSDIKFIVDTYNRIKLFFLRGITSSNASTFMSSTMSPVFVELLFQLMVSTTYPVNYKCCPSKALMKDNVLVHIRLGSGAAEPSTVGSGFLAKIYGYILNFLKI